MFTKFLYDVEALLLELMRILQGDIEYRFGTPEQ